MANQENKSSISVEEQKQKRKELVLKIKAIMEYVKQTNIEEQVKQDLIFMLDKILQRAVLIEEVVRLSDVVYKITKSEEPDNKYKGFLKSAIYKIYSSESIL